MFRFSPFLPGSCLSIDISYGLSILETGVGGRVNFLTLNTKELVPVFESAMSQKSGNIALRYQPSNSLTVTSPCNAPFLY